MHIYTYLCKNIISGLNIGDFILKLPIAKVYSSPIFDLIRYIKHIYTYFVLQLSVWMEVSIVIYSQQIQDRLIIVFVTLLIYF